jgi:hypothetical protein
MKGPAGELLGGIGCVQDPPQSFTELLVTARLGAGDRMCTVTPKG